MVHVYPQIGQSLYSAQVYCNDLPQSCVKIKLSISTSSLFPVQKMIANTKYDIGKSMVVS